MSYEQRWGSVMAGVTRRKDYGEFLARKSVAHVATGIAETPELSSKLKPFQRHIVERALRLGRMAIFSDCGTGKGWMALEWAHHVVQHTNKPVLIVAPLAVSQQFIREGDRLGVGAASALDGTPQREWWCPDVWVVNFDSLHKLERLIPQLGGVVIDEASILKNFAGATRNMLISSFAQTPFRLTCSATPAPNNTLELGSQVEFLGVMKRTEMMATWFINDGETTQEWRLKKHAERDFWRWCASWCVCIGKPSDIGYSDDGYDLPPLEMREHVIDVDQRMAREAGLLFAFEASSLREQRSVKRASIGERVEKAAELANADREQWIVWAGLNEESAALTKAIDGAVEITGSQPTEEKERRIMAFLQGEARVIVTKRKIMAHGLNAQRCARQCFADADHSFEQFYQAIRRSWRYGQTRPVQAHLIRTSADGRVAHNLERKRLEHEAMMRSMVEAMR